MNEQKNHHTKSSKLLMSDQSTKEKIQNDLIKFMKSGEKDKVEIIRFAQSFIKQLEKDKNIELSETETIQVLKKVIKRNQESYDQFIKAGRDELAAQEKKEMDIIKSYLLSINLSISMFLKLILFSK